MRRGHSPVLLLARSLEPLPVERPQRGRMRGVGLPESSGTLSLGPQSLEGPFIPNTPSEHIGFVIGYISCLFFLSLLSFFFFIIIILC